MKKNIIFILALFSSSSIVCGQVGINTENPQATLHVEGNQYVSTITKVGGGTTNYNTSASLELGDEHKAFLPNRVDLKGAGDDETIPDPVAGMVVYNTNSSPSLPSGLTYFDGEQWSRLVTELELSKKSTLNVRNLLTSADLPVGEAWPQPDNIELDFGKIEIAEDGNYVFQLRLYGLLDSDDLSPNLPFPYKQPFYLFIFANNVLKDAQELQENVLSVSHRYGTTAVLALYDLKKGDIITIKAAKYKNRAKLLTFEPVEKGEEALTAARTSLIWWKL